MAKIGIIGGGAAGMFAAVQAAGYGHEIHLYEQNEKLGKKLFITGKGRCNFTNDCPEEEFFRNIVTNAKFMYSSGYGYSSSRIMEFFEEHKVPVKVERGNRAFPKSDHSSDIIRALERALKDAGVRIHLGTRVRHLVCADGAVSGIVLEDGTHLSMDAVVLATGGLSYPSTGSTGDGYRMARECGHTVTELKPALVPLETGESYIPKLQGLSLKNVVFRVQGKKKPVFEGFGEMMFTHFGVTGPLVLSASSYIGKSGLPWPLSAEIDLKPALTESQLDERLIREFRTAQNRRFKNVVPELFPSRLVPVMIELSGIAPDAPVNGISKENRQRLAGITKHFPMTLIGTRPFREAIITQGGISVREVQPGTMESRKVRHLYFAGEILDVDALTGGFNLQVAWSTAYAAASAMEQIQVIRKEENI